MELQWAIGTRTDMHRFPGRCIYQLNECEEQYYLLAFIAICDIIPSLTCARLFAADHIDALINVRFIPFRFISNVTRIENKFTMPEPMNMDINA